MEKFQERLDRIDRLREANLYGEDEKVREFGSYLLSLFPPDIALSLIDDMLLEFKNRGK